MKKWFYSFRQTIAGFIFDCGEIPTYENELKQIAKTINLNDLVIISSDGIFAEYLKVFPKQAYLIGSRDSFYYMLTLDIIQKFNKVYLKWRPDACSLSFDCDNFSMDYMAALNRFVTHIKGAKHSFAIGMSSGLYHWETGQHQCNIAFVYGETDKIIFIEPQTGNWYNTSFANGNPNMLYV